jgi:hypothetical protein
MSPNLVAQHFASGSDDMMKAGVVRSLLEMVNPHSPGDQPNMWDIDARLRVVPEQAVARDHASQRCTHVSGQSFEERVLQNPLTPSGWSCLVKWLSNTDPIDASGIAVADNVEGRSDELVAVPCRDTTICLSRVELREVGRLVHELQMRGEYELLFPPPPVPKRPQQQQSLSRTAQQSKSDAETQHQCESRMRQSLLHVAEKATGGSRYDQLMAWAVNMNIAAAAAQEGTARAVGDDDDKEAGMSVADVVDEVVSEVQLAGRSMSECLTRGHCHHRGSCVARRCSCDPGYDGVSCERRVSVACIALNKTDGSTVLLWFMAGAVGATVLSQVTGRRPAAVRWLAGMLDKSAPMHKRND